MRYMMAVMCVCVYTRNDSECIIIYAKCFLRMSRKRYRTLNVNRPMMQLLEKWAYTSLMAIFSTPAAISKNSY